MSLISVDDFLYKINKQATATAKKADVLVMSAPLSYLDYAKVIALENALHTLSEQAGVIEISFFETARFDRESLNFNSPMRYRKTRTAWKNKIKLDNPKLIIDLESLSILSGDHKKWYKRRLEELRRLDFLVRSAFSASNSVEFLVSPNKLNRRFPLSLLALAGLLKCIRPFHIQIKALQPHSEKKNSVALTPTPFRFSSLSIVGLRCFLMLNASQFDQKTHTDVEAAIELVNHILERIGPRIEKMNSFTPSAYQDRPEGSILHARPLHSAQTLWQYKKHLHHLYFSEKNASDVDIMKWYEDDAMRALPQGSYLPDIFNQSPTYYGLKQSILKIFGAGFPIPPQFSKKLSAPIGGNPENIRFIELIAALLLNAPLPYITKTPWSRTELDGWIHSHLKIIRPDFFITENTPSQNETKTLDLIGYPKLGTGLTENLDVFSRHFSKLGFSPIIRDAAECCKLTNKTQFPTQPLLRKTNIHLVNADKIPLTLTAPSSWMKDKLEIGFLLWETMPLPENHRFAAELLDEIWVPSRFLEEAYKTLKPEGTRWIGKDITPPETASFDLEYFGIPKSAYSFLVCFDCNSGVERKNPLAAVSAFQHAFPIEREDVRLIIKTRELRAPKRNDPLKQLETIRKISKTDKRIILIEEDWSKNALYALIQAVDCVVSPHRAEGFGYIPAYALYYGTSVITTDFSGTTDYCTAETAFPVPYELTTALNQTAEWATIDSHMLCHTLLALPDCALLAKEKSKKGMALMRETYSTEAHSLRIKTALEELGAIAS